jgi:NADH-quinone oxidoreductase subunit N
MGSFGSALLLFGMSMVYGLTGTTEIARIAELIGSGNWSPIRPCSPGWVCSWRASASRSRWPLFTSDSGCLRGRTTIVTAFMSVGPKAAGFAIFGRVLFVGLPELHGHWGPVLAVLALLTMAVGNITALCQQSLKRMLAYSAIAHAGYALLGLLAGNRRGYGRHHDLSDGLPVHEHRRLCHPHAPGHAGCAL